MDERVDKFMYWNCVNNMCYKFMAMYHYTATEIHMSPDFYNNLFEEMCGAQWWFLLKNNSVRGLKIVIDDRETLFTIVGKEHTLTPRTLNESRWV